MKQSFDCIKNKISKNFPDLEVISERFITTKSKTRREILVKNKKTNCEFWAQPSRFYEYKIIRYNTENIKKYIDKITNGEYELIGECNSYKDIITIHHKLCNQTFNIRASHFINDGCRCKKCFIKSITKTNEEFDKKLSSYGNSHLKRVSDYINYHSKIKIFCDICNKEFITKPVDIQRQFKEFGEIHCLNCSNTNKKSIGESFVREILKKNNIIFKEQYRNSKCIDKATLPFDFAIFNSKNNIIGIIEFDGSQHFDKKSKYSKNGKFEITQKHDIIKNNFCNDNKIPLLRVNTYNKLKLEKEIESFLSNTVNK